MDPVALGLIVGLGSQLIGNIFNWFAGQQAENNARQAAQKQRTVVGALLNKLGSGPEGAIRSQIATASDVLGGRLAASGLTGSSIGGAAYSDLAARTISRITPAWWNAMLGATNLAMSPEKQLMGMYGNAANQASGNMGFDLSFLPYLLYMNGGSGAAAGAAAGGSLFSGSLGSGLMSSWGYAP